MIFISISYLNDGFARNTVRSFVDPHPFSVEQRMWLHSDHLPGGWRLSGDYPPTSEFGIHSKSSSWLRGSGVGWANCSCPAKLTPCSSCSFSRYQTSNGRIELMICPKACATSGASRVVTAVAPKVVSTNASRSRVMPSSWREASKDSRGKPHNSWVNRRQASTFPSRMGNVRTIPDITNLLSSHIFSVIHIFPLIFSLIIIIKSLKSFTRSHAVADQALPLHLYALGPPEVRLGENLVTFPTRKTLALLIYLALESGPQQREALSTILWPEASPQAIHH